MCEDLYSPDNLTELLEKKEHCIPTYEPINLKQGDLSESKSNLSKSPI